MIRIIATIACVFLAATATAAGGAWQRVFDFSTSATCRDAEGIAFSETTGTLFAVKGNSLYHFAGAGQLIRVVTLDERVVPDFNGIESLPTGNLLLVAGRPRRLYEVTPNGRKIEIKSLGDRVAPRGVAYCAQRKRIYVLDGADRSVKEYTTADEPEAFYKIRLPDARAVVVPHPGVLWLLDGRQRKVFSYRPGGVLTELIDLRQICSYEGPSGLALDRSRGILFICFAKSQRVVGVVDAGAGLAERAEPQRDGHDAPANGKPHRIVYLPPQTWRGPPGFASPVAMPDPKVLPAPVGEHESPDRQTPRPAAEVPSPYPASTIIVKPPYPPTVYVLPLIVRGAPVHPDGPAGRTLPGWHGEASPTCPPDLTVSDLEVISVTGGRITFRYRVNNFSRAPANLDAVIVHAVVSADCIRNTGDKLVADHVFYSEVLAPGQSRWVTDQGVLREGFNGRPFLIVEVDTADRLAESNEDNNATVTLTTFAR